MSLCLVTHLHVFQNEEAISIGDRKLQQFGPNVSSLIARPIKRFDLIDLAGPVAPLPLIEILCATKSLHETKIFLDETLPSIVGIKSIAPAIASNVYKFETDWTPFANEA